MPEIASRNHIEAISRVTKKALENSKLEFKDIDVIAPTYRVRFGGSSTSWIILW